MGYTNSPLATYTKISPNRTSPRNHALDTITIHCIVGQWTARQGVDYFARQGLNAAPNYVVGKDGSIGLCVPESDRSWCTGGSLSVLGKTGRDNDHRAVTIETASDTTNPYAVTDAAYNALVDLVTDICRRNGKRKLLWFGDPVKTVSYQPNADEMLMTVHRWFASKSCPGDYLYSRQKAIADEVNRRLTEEDDEDMTLDTFKKLMGEYRKEQQDNDCGTWSQEARDWATSTGFILGSGKDKDGNPNYMWADTLTREQAAQLFYRFAQMMGMVK